MLRATAILLALLVAAAALARGADEMTDESTKDYRKALAIWKKGHWAAAQHAFRKMLEEYPDSVHRSDAEVRSDDNCYLGTEDLHVSGPPERRIDVAVMGDGFTIDRRDQQLEEKWAKLCLEVLWNEASFREYRDYMNLYFVRLASLEEGVDPNLSPEKRAEIEERNRRRTRKRKTEYDTALDCKAAGPQGQVMADAGLVYRWLGVADEDHPGCGHDGLVIAFARFGRLGMGGGGIANVGRPDKSVTVHEFGHAFTGLLDEYANNPSAPPYPIRAANATSDRDDIPWQHFLDAKVKGVGVYEGGATFKKGVWRPARSCAMNASGDSQFCPVCREANVLAIYRYVNPIDAATPDPAEAIRVAEGDDTVIEVTPMRPRSHDLGVSFFVAPLAEGDPSPIAGKKKEGSETDWWGRVKDRGGWGRRFGGGGSSYRPGERGRESRDHLDEPPKGEASRLAKRVKGRRGAPTVHRFPVGKLPPGRYAVTAVVKDETPWVLKDENHLLEERETWEVFVE